MGPKYTHKLCIAQPLHGTVWNILVAVAENGTLPYVVPPSPTVLSVLNTPPQLDFAFDKQQCRRTRFGVTGMQ
jgi:hypothetical protein